MHEECLKTWLLLTNQTIKHRTCELCHTTYVLTMKTKRSLSCEGVCKEHFGGCIFAGILIGILGLIITLVVLLERRYQVSDNSNQSYLLALIIGCGIAGLIILLLIMCIIKGLLVQSKIQIFSIQNYEPAPEIKKKEEIQMNNNILSTDFNEVDHSPLQMLIKSKDRKIYSLKIVPLCQAPIFEENSLIGYNKNRFNDNMSNSCFVKRSDTEKISLFHNNSA